MARALRAIRRTLAVGVAVAALAAVALVPSWVEDEKATTSAVLGSQEVVDAQLRRVRYTSTGVDGAPVEVTGLVAIPSGDPPSGGWPVVAYARPASGVADACAPSTDPAIAAVGHVLGTLASAGYVAVATDYVGVGTPPEHAFLHGRSEAAAVVDGVRAARETVPDASQRWAVVGTGQGGHAALFAAELADDLAPELDLVAAVAIDAVGDPAELAGPLLQSGSGWLLLTVLGWLAVDPAVDFATDASTVLTAGAELAAADIEHDCAVTAVGDRVLGGHVERFGRYLAANRVGQEHTDVPLLIVDALRPGHPDGADILRTVDRLCRQGDTVAVHEGPAEHVHGVARAWIADRFAGLSVVSACPEAPA